MLPVPLLRHGDFDSRHSASPASCQPSSPSLVRSNNRRTSVTVLCSCISTPLHRRGSDPGKNGTRSPSRGGAGWLPTLPACTGGDVRNSTSVALPVPLRAVTAVVVAFLPVFFANLVFAKRFADSADSTSAFAANLLGAMVGGCLEYLSLVFGYQALLLLAGLLYLGAFALLPRRVPVPAG